jgi:hypothetical protein
MKKLKVLLALLVAMGLSSTLISCDRSDAERAEDKIERGVEKAGDKIEDAGDKIEEKTERDRP